MRLVLNYNLNNTAVIGVVISYASELISSYWFRHPHRDLISEDILSTVDQWFKLRGGPDNAEFKPDYTSPPGETVQECMAEVLETEVDYARKLGLSVAELQKLFQGEHRINTDLAEKLEQVTGVPQQFWANREQNFWECLMDQ